jgi:hypothetical protein
MLSRYSCDVNVTYLLCLSQFLLYFILDYDHLSMKRSFLAEKVVIFQSSMSLLLFVDFYVVSKLIRLK